MDYKDETEQHARISESAALELMRHISSRYVMLRYNSKTNQLIVPNLGNSTAMPLLIKDIFDAIRFENTRVRVDFDSECVIVDSAGQLAKKLTQEGIQVTEAHSHLENKGRSR